MSFVPSVAAGSEEGFFDWEYVEDDDKGTFGCCNVAEASLGMDRILCGGRLGDCVPTCVVADGKKFCGKAGF